MEVRVEIIAIGDELCCGRVYDTNSFWIADKVTRLGATVQRIICVPDAIEEICEVLKQVLNRKPHYVIMTGGLGPTSDDLTLVSLSKLTGIEIETRQEILQNMVERRGISMDDLPAALLKMARSLSKAVCLPNPVGWAPVTLLERGVTTIVVFPGPPREMKACFNEYLPQRITDKTHQRSHAKKVFVTMYESSISLITNEIMLHIPGVYLKPLVGEYQRNKGLPVDIVVFAKNEIACVAKMEQVINRLRKQIDTAGANLRIE